MILPHPSLRLLARFKLRGALRRQRARLARPSGVVFALVGMGLFALWLLPVVASWQGAPLTRRSPEELAAIIGVACFAFTLLGVSSALSHRGLYLPKDEIERLFSAPVSRADLVRYRLWASLGRASFGGLVLGTMSFRHMPEPVFGFLGAFLATLTLPIIGQGAAILAGSAENRLAARLARLPWRAVTLVVIAALTVFILSGVRAGPSRRPRFGALDSVVGSTLEHPVVEALALPFRPWVELMTARGPVDFLTWLGVCLVLWVALFELVARLPVDFRELSLATSADVAKRIRRRARVGGFAGSAAVRSKPGGAVPRCFGRGSFGTIAWRKTASLLRKSRGALFTAALVIAGVTFAAGFVRFDGAGTFPAGPAMIAIVGTLYLSAGLRLDFREDLDLMEQMKAWPVAPWRVFLATILPEVCVVSLLVDAGVVARAVMDGFWHPALLLIVAAVPPLVLLWVALDNLVFLLVPVRYVPGQDGALHNAGRTMLMMLVRLVALSVLGLGLVAAVLLASLLGSLMELDEELVPAVGAALFAVVLALELLLLVRMGGRFFRRFDVARDRA